MAGINIYINRSSRKNINGYKYILKCWPKENILKAIPKNLPQVKAVKKRKSEKTTTT